MELLALLGVALAGAVICALLLAGLFKTPWLILAALLLLVVALFRMPTRTPEVETIAETEDKPASSMQLTYRGACYAPQSPTRETVDPASLVEHSGTYRGHPWSARDVQV